MSAEVEKAAELELASARTAQDVVRAGTGFASTIPMDTVESRLAVLDALSDPDSLSDNEGVVIELAGILAQETRFKDASGTMVDGIATYLVGKDGRTFISVSTGIASSVQQFIGVMGENPANWPPGLTFTPVKKNIGGGKTTWIIKTGVAPTKNK